MEHRQDIETPMADEGVRDDAPTAPQMSFGWTFESLPFEEARRLARASRMDEGEYSMLREQLTRLAEDTSASVRITPPPRRVVPKSPESLSQGREESRCGDHRQARPRRPDRLLESHRAGNRAARKTQHSAATSTSPEDRGADTVSAPGGKTQACFHANDTRLTPPS